MKLTGKLLNIATFALLGVAAMMAAPEARSQDAVTAEPVAGSCPISDNACTGPDGCFAINPSVYRVYKGMAQCTWGLSGCNNTISRPCYEKFNVVNCTPPLVSDYGTGTTVNENACR